MSKKEVIAYIIAMLLVFLIIGGIGFGLKWVQAKIFYGGDTRCIFAECRINK